jgi:hypothetical protein
MAGFFHGRGILRGLVCCRPEFDFGQMVIVDFSAAGIDHCSRMTNTTAPR